MVKLKELLKEAPRSPSFEKALRALRYVAVNVFDEDASSKWNIIKYMHSNTQPLGKFYRALQVGDPYAWVVWPTAKKFLDNHYDKMLKDKNKAQIKAMKELDKLGRKLKV